MRVERTLRTVLLCLGVLMVAMSVGCGEPPPLDMSLLTGEPCEPPCWQGLSPGESTEEDVAEFIRTTRFVDTRTIYRGRITRGGDVVGVSIWWRSTAARSRNVESNSFDIDTGVLEDITIYPDYDLTLERLFERYGPPEKYVANLRGFERRWVEVTLYYPTHGFTVDLVLPYNGRMLQPESKVTSVWYFRAAPLERFLELRYEAGYGGPTPDERLRTLRDWPGYGAIKVD